MKLCTVIIGIIIIVIVVMIFQRGSEGFDIPVGSSSAWDWNTGPGYGAGYGTGYSMYGEWPAEIKGRPWKWWMWGRRPLIFKTPYTPVPQIDYNTAPDPVSKPTSNYTVSILPDNGKIKLAINGMPRSILQLDRLREYYFHVYSPGAPFMISADGESPYMFEPVEIGTVTITFAESAPDILYYSVPGNPGSGGIIYLNTPLTSALVGNA